MLKTFDNHTCDEHEQRKDFMSFISTRFSVVWLIRVILNTIWKINRKYFFLNWRFSFLIEACVLKSLNLIKTRISVGTMGNHTCDWRARSLPELQRVADPWFDHAGWRVQLLLAIHFLMMWFHCSAERFRHHKEHQSCWSDPVHEQCRDSSSLVQHFPNWCARKDRDRNCFDINLHKG